MFVQPMSNASPRLSAKGRSRSHLFTSCCESNHIGLPSSATGPCKAEECSVPATAFEDRLLDTEEARSPSQYFQLLSWSLAAIVAICQRGTSLTVHKLRQKAAV